MSIHSIVDRQVHLWGVNGPVGGHAEHVQPCRPWPLITISREAGAGGAQLGERLSTQLGFGYWNRQLLTTIAERLGVNEEELAQVDERAPNAVSEFLELLMHFGEVPAAEFGDRLRQVVGGLQRRGAAVIVGRGAHLIVEPLQALRVRLTAPLEYRVHDYAAHEGLTLDAARRVLLELDRDRRGFIERQFGVRAEDASQYDLVLNVQALGMDNAQELVLTAYRLKFGQLPGG
jgi:cytidylate kinase